MQDVKAGDPQGWQRLARLYAPTVYGWCRRRGLQSQDAEDVVQEVFLTVAVKVAGFRHDNASHTFRGWLWTITRNKLGDWMRKQETREKAVGGTDPNLLEAPEPVSQSWNEPDEAGGLYQRALNLIRAEFEEQSWQAFWRVAVEGRSPADTALALGMTRNAVYVAKSRVLRRLRDVLGDA